jgi:hypothetical protein
MITENLLTLEINKLTNEQYNRELDAGNIDENALYLTPDDTYSKAEIEAMMPKVITANAYYDGNGYVNIKSSELQSLRSSNRERIIYLVLGSLILEGGTVDTSAVINLCSTIASEHSNTLKQYGDTQGGTVWCGCTVGGNKNYFANSPLLILAVKGDGIGLAFEYVHWLNPPKANG